jgi:conjugative transfer signal peptidase TraF
MFGRKVSAGCLSVVVALAIATPHVGLRLNQSASMPQGIWIERSNAGHAYAVGDIVEACPHLADWQRIYLGAGDCPNGSEPMLKPVAAVPGDTVSVNSLRVVINGKPIPATAPLAHDRQGRTLRPFAAGRYTVQAGEVWLIVPRSDSLDSRYLGPVSIADVRGLAAPVWVRK